MKDARTRRHADLVDSIAIAQANRAVAHRRFPDTFRRLASGSGEIQASPDGNITAMTQTTLIGGLGLAVFAFSTFTPTQRFGVMMVTLLAAALVGDLILLPALLAGPLGRFFAITQKEPSEQPAIEGTDVDEETRESAAGSNGGEETGVEGRGETRHSAAIRRVAAVRTDQNHDWPRH